MSLLSILSILRFRTVQGYIAYEFNEGGYESTVYIDIVDQYKNRNRYYSIYSAKYSKLNIIIA